jgi:adenosylcobyric acid synthase
MLSCEDSLGLSLDATHDRPPSPLPLRIGVVALPHLSNPSDLDPLRAEPDVELRWIRRPSDLGGVDLAILPGSRATVADLEWLATMGIDTALQQSQRCTILGICGGYQMMGTMIHDDIESGRGSIEGLGLLPATTTFVAQKRVVRVSYRCGDHRVEGYEIRYGRPRSATPWFVGELGPEGAADGEHHRFGTSVHGIFDNDGFRAEFLGAVAQRHGRVFRPHPTPFSALLDTHLDELADWASDHLDIDQLLDIGSGAATSTTMGWTTPGPSTKGQW